MNIKQWLHQNKCRHRREAVAKKAGTSVAYLWQLAGEHRACRKPLAKALADATGGEITVVHAMIPDQAEPNAA